MPTFNMYIYSPWPVVCVCGVWRWCRGPMLFTPAPRYPALMDPAGRAAERAVVTQHSWADTRPPLRHQPHSPRIPKAEMRCWVVLATLDQYVVLLPPPSTHCSLLPTDWFLWGSSSLLVVWRWLPSVSPLWCGADIEWRGWCPADNVSCARLTARHVMHCLVLWPSFMLQTVPIPSRYPNTVPLPHYCIIQTMDNTLFHCILTYFDGSHCIFSVCMVKLLTM